MKPIASVSLATLVVGVASGVGPLLADERPPESSPFVATTSASAPAVPAESLGAYELAGVSHIGSRVMICLTTSRPGSSRWLTVGAEEAGLWVERFDDSRDAALLRVGEASRWVSLRQATAAGIPVARLEDGSVDWLHMNLTEKQKETEAQMMMWDILEVGRLARQGRLPSAATPPEAGVHR